MAITFPLVTLANGAVISKTFIDAVVDDINHLYTRPDGYATAAGTGATATTATYVQPANPTITVTPKITGNMLIIARIGLQHSVANGAANARIDMNGSKLGVATGFLNDRQYIPLVVVAPVTANVSYTLLLEFNNSQGSGTVTLNTNMANLIYAVEVG